RGANLHGTEHPLDARLLSPCCDARLAVGGQHAVESSRRRAQVLRREVRVPLDHRERGVAEQLLQLVDRALIRRFWRSSSGVTCCWPPTSVRRRSALCSKCCDNGCSWCASGRW